VQVIASEHAEKVAADVSINAFWQIIAHMILSKGEGTKQAKRLKT
jgi:hypothetical protein